MTKDLRNQVSLQIFSALVLTACVSPVHAAIGAKQAPALDGKSSSRHLLQIAQARAAEELTNLKAELSRETLARLAAFTYDLEGSAPAIVPAAESIPASTPIETRVAATIADEALEHTP